jgi:hypothetical protein
MMGTALDTPAATRRGKANCGFCGKARFGDVAYCPYCGRPSASAPTGTGAHAPPAADRDAAARADAPAPAPQATLRPVLKPQPGSAASAPAADGRAMQALANSIHSYAGRMRRFGAPAGARAEARTGQQGMRWVTRWMGIIASAMALALLGIAVQDVAERNSARRVPAAGAAGTAPSEASARVAAPRAAPAPAPATAAVTAPATPNGGASAPPAQALGAGPAMPRADTAPPQQPPAAATPARNRTLCSAANEAAGLCNPQ